MSRLPSVQNMTSTSATPYDVIFIGAGHNALVAAAYLTRAGRRVCLLERADVPGGWVRSEELTLPGFVHDTYSALHPSFVFGPAFAELGPELAGHGLRYVQGSVATGSSLPDGRSAVISTDPAELAAELDRLGDGEAWGQADGRPRTAPAVAAAAARHRPDFGRRRAVAGRLGGHRGRRPALPEPADRFRARPRHRSPQQRGAAVRRPALAAAPGTGTA